MSDRVLLVHFNHIYQDGVFTWPDLLTSKWRPNYGDMFVCAALSRLLDPKVPRDRIGFGDTAKTAYKSAIMRGSTYLHDGMDFEAVNRTIESISGPIACVGLGAQNPTLDPTYLDANQGARKFIALLNERSASISVRGAFTADVVARLGGRNVRVTGCPSLFYFGAPKPMRSVEPLRSEYRRIGASIHTGLSRNVFCRDPALTFKRHAELFLHLSKQPAGATVFEQGNIDEYVISDRSIPYNDRIEKASQLLKKLGGASAIPADQLASWFAHVTNVQDWLSKAFDLDAMIGFRFHGNMVGLAQGLPCYFYHYDSRIEEFCDLYGLPSARVEDDFVDPIQKMIEHDWADTETKLKKCHEEMKAFFSENNIPASNLLK